MTYLLTSNKPSEYNFGNDKFKMLLIEYPQWEASISSAESDIWVKVIPKIDLTRRVIFYPHLNKKSKKTSDIITSDGIDKLLRDNEAILIDDFFNSIPVEIIQAVSKFSDSHWEIVKAIKLIGKDLLSLININPALAYTIVNIEKINPSFSCFGDTDVLQRMIRKRHKEILGLIGFPESERMTKIFSKLEPSTLNLDNIIALKKTLLLQPGSTENILKLLSYSKIINKNLLRLVTSDYHIIESMTHKLIFDIIESENFEDILKSLNEILSCSKQLKQDIPQLNASSSILKVNGELKKRLSSRVKRNMIFPPAPIVGNECIQPICNESELKIWARRQQNCIAGYSGKVRLGKSYFYRVVNNDEEATLELKLKDKKIRMNALLGKSNRKVSPILKKVVSEWLNENKF